MSEHDEAVLTAALDVVSRTGAVTVQVRYHDDQEPTVWLAVAGHHLEDEGVPSAGDPNYWTAAGGMNPTEAVCRLAEKLVDGGTCAHCSRPTGFDEDWSTALLDDVICWSQWDPELRVFRRGCS